MENETMKLNIILDGKSIKEGSINMEDFANIINSFN